MIPFDNTKIVQEEIQDDRDSLIDKIDDSNEKISNEIENREEEIDEISIAPQPLENRKGKIGYYWSKVKNLNKKKIIVGFMIINLAFTLYLSYNNPTSMVKIFDKHYDIDSRKFGYLYSVYAIPNLFMVFLGGILVDTYGPETCSLIFNFTMTLSTVLAALSTTPPRYGLLLFSRVLLGIGGESLLVCVSCFMAKWFSSKEMPFIVAIESTWVQFGSLLAFGFLPTLYENTNLPFTVWFVAIIGIFGFFLNIIFILFGKTKLYYPKDNEKPEIINECKEEVSSSQQQDDPNELVSSEKPILASNTDIEMDSLEFEDITNTIKDEPIQDDNENKMIKTLKEFKKAILLVRLIPPRMWILVCIAFFGYSSFYGLDIIATDMIIEKYNYNERSAALVMACETLLNGVCCPLFPYVTKALKKRTISLCVGICTMGIGIFILIVTPTVPLPWVVLSGLGYGLMNNTLISAVPLLVDEKVIGTAYGLIGTSYNVGIVIYPLFLSYFREKTGTYNFSMVLLVFSAAISLIFLFILKKLDLKEPTNEKKLDNNITTNKVQH
ncbi:hypothetical protein DLAC_09554 [Tieghemostelium lacteum]|uniref:Lysosomal dipeptide transporter MFSD1 n=1 Tax=Tieghemostelium lacteum TaxID=361077 RepID=A0A151Z6P0_TIELA|nr:hypothetical protein DLAC_09554 [Tieghemostelium lacteum]|eukprot:KYQ89597.1 hypothetical protein DLAC_09554 [Tieghemostelium lacteum]